MEKKQSLPGFHVGHREYREGNNFLLQQQFETSIQSDGREYTTAGCDFAAPHNVSTHRMLP